MTLAEKSTLVATEAIPCDCSVDIFSIADSRDAVLISKHLVGIFKSRHKKISKDAEYVHYVFVDDEGEVQEMNCSVWADGYMIRNKLYPQIILDAIDNFKNLK